MAYKVFLSHAGDDETLATAVAEGLEKLNVAVYMFEKDLAAGEHLPKKLVERIRSSDALVALLTKYAVESPAVSQEIGVAVDARVQVVPVVEHGVDFTKFTLLQGVEYVPLDTEEPSETVADVTARIANMRHKSLIDLIRGSLAIGIAIWFARNKED